MTAQILMFPDDPQTHRDMRELCKALGIPFCDAIEMSPLEQYMRMARQEIMDVMMIPAEMLK